jgi:hypothetical protein
MATQKASYVIGTPGNFVVASDKGVTLMGKSITMGTTSENVRNGGMFVEMNDFVKMVPTTVVTPMPGQIPFPPLGLITSIAKDMDFFLAMLG